MHATAGTEQSRAIRVAQCAKAVIPSQMWALLQVVVCTELALNKAVDIDDFCHRNAIGFIKADTYGVFAQVFCDFGDDFIVHDVNGEPAARRAWAQPCKVLLCCCPTCLGNK